MSDDLSIELSWERGETELRPEGYSNAHVLRFGPGHVLSGDAAPGWGGDPANTNPEQALAAFLSSCHMMTFLALSAKAGWPVARYDDRAVAYLGRNAKGCMSVTRIELNPSVAFDEGFVIDETGMATMHGRAHRYCFIANTLSESVEIAVTARPGGGQ
ncbi:OsmC family protein [uncultured Jannaschia sp.]|uniref:OsmC family protein n=1 Tax=uncultured Jannaschia sp. TaxID=293347 RepID=UPI00262A8A0D|nr:OsmC family protein [uncultured Jannaschia sp.]